MGQVTIERDFPGVPRQRVFELLADVGQIHAMHPFVERSPVPQGKPDRGEGAERVCHFYDGNQVSERVVRVVEGQLLEIEIFAGTMPVDDARVLLELADLDDGGACVTMSMRYRSRYGMLGSMMDALVMRRKFASMLELLLAGIHEHARTGAVIEKGWRPAA